MIRCPRCGAINRDDAQYCGKCKVRFKKPKRPQDLKKVKRVKKAKKQPKKPKRTFKMPKIPVPKRLQNINKRRLFAVIAIIVIVAVAGFYIFGDKHVDVGGIKFSIPNQFNEKYADELINYTGSNNTARHEPIDYHLKVYADDKGQEIAIDVSAPSGKRVFSEDALERTHTGTASAVNGQEGYFVNSTQFKYSFEFIKHGKLVCVRSNEMKFIEAVV